MPILSRIALAGLLLQGICSLPPAAAQNRTVAARLGYPSDAKLLIIHADDLGMDHSVDEASFDALDHQNVNSASVMMPCSWVPEVMDYARKHPDVDMGLHLAINSDWRPYRWGPVAGRQRVPSLLDPELYLWRNGPDTVKRSKPAEVEEEVRAQIDLALRMGLRPTHVDPHEATLESSREFFAIYVKLAHEYHLPFRAERRTVERRGWQDLLSPTDIILDAFLEPNYRVPPDQWLQSYLKMLDRVVPGLNQMIVHLGFDDSELKAATGNVPDWGAAWRQRDVDLVRNPAFKEALRSRNITLVRWRDVQKLNP